VPQGAAHRASGIPFKASDNRLHPVGSQGLAFMFMGGQKTIPKYKFPYKTLGAIRARPKANPTTRQPVTRSRQGKYAAISRKTLPSRPSAKAGQTQGGATFTYQGARKTAIHRSGWGGSHSSRAALVGFSASGIGDHYPGAGKVAAGFSFSRWVERPRRAGPCVAPTCPPRWPSSGLPGGGFELTVGARVIPWCGNGNARPT